MVIKQILVPIDFSQASLQALAYAVEFGRPFKPEVVVLHVVEPIYAAAPTDSYSPVGNIAILLDELQRTGRQQLERIATDLHKHRVKTQTLLQIGTPYEVIVATAKKLRVDLIIMATHGRTGLSHVFMGSVAERVVRSAACPVLTVRGHESTGRRSRPRAPAATRPERRRRRGATVRR